MPNAIIVVVVGVLVLAMVVVVVSVVVVVPSPPHHPSPAPPHPITPSDEVWINGGATQTLYLLCVCSKLFEATQF